MLRRTMAPSGFRGRLLLIFLGIGIVPLVITAAAFFSILNASLQAETFAKLAFARDAKASEIAQYLTFATRQAESLVQSNAVRYAIGDFYGFAYAFRQIDSSPERATATLQQMFGIEEAASERQLPTDRDAILRSALEYANAHTQFHDDFAGFIVASEFDNVYLVTPERRVVYSVEKDRYLGSDLKGSMAGTALAEVTAQLAQAPQDQVIVVRDFAVDGVTGDFAAYMAIRVVFYGKLRGTVIFRLPARGLDGLMQSQSDTAGGLFLLSSEQRLISVPGDSNVRPGDLDTHLTQDGPRRGAAVVDEGVAGHAALSAWAPLRFQGLDWMLVAEIPAELAFADSLALQRVLLAIAAVFLPILFGLVFYLSRTMTAPLQALSAAAESIAAGDLDRTMPEIAGPSELARLSASFRRMRDSIKEQLGLIGQKTEELERQVGLIEDKNRALEEADLLKDTFLANTSHELRTPLNGIIGISETLAAGAAGDVSKPQRHQLDLITLSARRLSRLVDDLLDLYRIRQGRMRLDIHPVHVGSSVRNVMQLSEPLLRGEPVTLNVDIPETLPFVMTDPVRFEQILYNLLGNAIKYTRQGAIVVSAIAEEERVAISVSDTGSGISPENLERMFQPLEQAEPTEPDRKPVGTGLGLTIARQLATALEGRLTAESTPGTGSTFTIRLPAAPLSHAADLTAARGQPHDDAVVEPLVDVNEDADSPLILVVDDEPINIQVLRNVLQPRAYRVRTAENGLEALHFIDRQRPDLVVLDVMMPEMSGLEVARRLRQRFSLHELPIIMVTARGRTRDVIAGFDHGANDYVIKPFVKEELLSRVATLLAASRARNHARENSELRAEIDRRIRVEDALRLSQQRMARLLDTLDAGLLAVNDAGRISYANLAARRHFVGDIVLGTTELVDLLPQSAFVQMADIVESAGEGELRNVMLGENGERVLLHAFEIDAEAGAGYGIVISGAADEEADGLAHSVRGVMESIGTSLVTPPAGEARSGSEVLFQQHQGDARERYRLAIVDLMTGCVATWRKLTGLGKIEFAERSGVWRVNLDRSSLHARTLDKYLLIETLPRNPRWREVVQSADFVLSELDRTIQPDTWAAERADLMQKLEILRECVRNFILARPAQRTLPASNLDSQ